MSPTHRRRRTALPPPAVELPPDLQDGLRDADTALGELHSPMPTCAALRGLTLAFQLNGAAATYLSLAGWEAREQLLTPRPRPDQPARHHGPYAPADGHGALTDRAAHRAAALRAWPYTLEGRRVAGDMTTPAPLERSKPVRAVSLALEAAGVPPAETTKAGNVDRYLHTGYQTRAFTPGSARVDWRRQSGDPDATTVEDGLAQCAAALSPRGWESQTYRDRNRRYYLLAWPQGTTNPLDYGRTRPAGT